ncbi:GQ67_03703T0 [Komagataella phaffii]|nr:GQ67_03703T0 [Komagataella phaffii]AOA69339.1 GQ68_03675T0 [Komagataella phaffii GS115]
MSQNIMEFDKSNTNNPNNTVVTGPNRKMTVETETVDTTNLNKQLPLLTSNPTSTLETPISEISQIRAQENNSNTMSSDVAPGNNDSATKKNTSNEPTIINTDLGDADLKAGKVTSNDQSNLNTLGSHSRAAIFAAKIQDAITRQDSTQNVNETFVYESSVPIVSNADDQSQQQSSMDTSTNVPESPQLLSSKSSLKLPQKDSQLLDVEPMTELGAGPVASTSKNSPLKSKTHSVNGSLDMTNSQLNRSGQKKTSSQPNLRTITSRLFESKKGRPYSGLSDLFDDDDSYTEELGFNRDGTITGSLDSGAELLYTARQHSFEDDNPKPSKSHHPKQGSIVEGSHKNSTFDGKLEQGLYDYPAYGYQEPLLLDHHECPLEYGSTSVSNNNRHKLKRHSQNIKPDHYYYSPHDFTSTKMTRLRQVKHFCYTASLISAFLIMGFLFGFFIAITKPLTNFTVDRIDNILLTKEEIVFSLTVKGFNPGFVAIEIDDVLIDFFAKSSHLNDGNEDGTPFTFDESSLDTVLLGSINRLPVPLVFQGGFFSRNPDEDTTEIKILNPAQKPLPEPTDSTVTTTTTTTTNTPASVTPTKSIITSIITDTQTVSTTNSSTIPRSLEDVTTISLLPIPELQRRSKSPSEDNNIWEIISKYPFELVVRGVLLYKLPFSPGYNSLSINKAIMIDPDNLNGSDP